MTISRFSAAIALFGAGTAPLCAQVAPPVAAAIETQPSLQSGADSAAVLVDPAAPERSLILGSGKSAGIEVYDMSGKRLSSFAAGDIRALDLRAGAAPGGGALVAALDARTGAPRLLTASAGGTLTPISFAGPGTTMTPVGLCLARNHRDDATYLFMLGEGGEIEQWLLASTPANGLEGRLARRWAMGSEVGYCTADDRGTLYVSQEAVGVWSFAVDPEAMLVPRVVDIVRLGHITEEAKGVAVAPDGRLIVSDASANRLNLYDPDKDHAYLGSVTLGGGAIDAVTDAGGLAVARTLPGFAGGMLVVADDDNAPDATNYKLVSWHAVLAAAGLPERPAPPAPARMVNIAPTAETVPVETGGDAADDPAIWIHPTDPAKSVVIATQKQSGLYVYDMAGKPLQFLPDGRMNNVDLRDGYRLGGKAVTLVAASDRTHKSIALYTLDPDTRRLTSVADGVQATGLDDPYGLCLYRSRKSGKAYAFVNQPDGRMRQWELVATPAGKIRAVIVRDIAFASQVEGCVADDDTGMLYVGEEDVGLWRLGAEPNGGRAREMFAAVKDNPALKDDMEGIGLVRLDRTRGYLVVSSQGNDSYAVFRREGGNAYVGSFAVGANAAAGIDGVSETDGLDVTASNAGAGFEGGIMVAQDGRNVSPPENQNFKFVPWARIAAALKLQAR